ncbi:MAG: phytase, partial [Pseudomonadota bacterium]|nr:phytase [Pseudomonadota bacterium]
MTNQRHTKTVFKTTFTTAALSSTLLTLFGCAASHDTNTSANIKLAHSESQLVKAESQDIALPLTKLKNGLSLTLHYQTHADHSNTKSAYKDAYKDTHANNTSKDARANNKHKVYDDTHAININVNQHKGISLSNSEGKKHFIEGNYTLASAEVVESNS